MNKELEQLQCLVSCSYVSDSFCEWQKESGHLLVGTKRWGHHIGKNEDVLVWEMHTFADMYRLAVLNSAQRPVEDTESSQVPLKVQLLTCQACESAESSASFIPFEGQLKFYA